MKKIAIIGTYRMAWIYGINAKEMGIETHSFGIEENPICKSTVTEHHVMNILDMDALVDKCREIGIDGVVATTELTVSVCAYVAEKLGLCGMSYSVAREVTDKYRNRKLCKRLQYLQQPNFIEINDLNEFNKHSFEFPIILKPISRGGKRGIIVVNQKEDLENAFLFAKKEGGNAPVIIEEYITGGKEYSVESLSYKGKHYIIQVTEKITSGPPHCVELGHHQPAALSDGMRYKVELAIKEGLTAIGVDNTACHTEIKIVDNQIYLIEFNTRPGGDHIAWPLTTLSTGYSYIKGALRIALDDFIPVDTTKLQQSYAGVYFVTTQSAHLKPIFDSCDGESWLYEKNKVSEDLVPLVHNDCYGVNYIMYLSKKGRIELNENI